MYNRQRRTTPSTFPFKPSSPLPCVKTTNIYRGDYVEISLDTGEASWHGLFRQHPELVQKFIDYEGYLCIYTRFKHHEQPEVEGDCIYYHPTPAKPLDIQGLFINIASTYLGQIPLPDNSGSFCRIGLVEPATTKEHLDKFKEHNVEVSLFKTIEPGDEITTRFWDFKREGKPNEYFNE